MEGLHLTIQGYSVVAGYCVHISINSSIDGSRFIIKGLRILGIRNNSEHLYVVFKMNESYCLVLAGGGTRGAYQWEHGMH